MNYLETITDKMIFSNPEFGNAEKYDKRLTVKAIVKNKENCVALIVNDVHNLYTLPGGGAESDDLALEIARECREEINCEIENIQELVRVKEFRNRESKEYETICYVADMGKSHDEDIRTDDEKKNGLRVEWVSTEKAAAIFSKQMEMLNKGEISFYNTAFNVYRDNAFWQEYLK